MLQIVLATFITIISALWLLYHHSVLNKRSDVERLTRREELISTVRKGFVYQTIVMEYRETTGVNLDSGTFVELALKFYKSFDVAVLPEVDGVQGVVTNFDGKGGWLYQTDTGLVTLNSRSTFHETAQRGVNLNAIRFAPQPTIPGYKVVELGLDDQELHRVRAMVRAAVTNYLRSARSP